VRNIIIFEPSSYALSELRHRDLPYPGATPDESGLPLALIFRAFGAVVTIQTFEAKVMLEG